MRCAEHADTARSSSTHLRAPTRASPIPPAHRDDKKRFHVTREVFTMLNQSAAELDRAQKDFGKGKLVDG